MKYVKILGLLAVAAAALVAFAGTAMATTVTTTTGGAAATPTIHWINSGGHVTLKNPVADISCSSTVEGKVESHGAGVTAKGIISTLNFTGCTNGWHVTAVTNGSLEVHYTSGHNGVLTSSGAKVDTTRLGVTCVYQTNNTSIGTVTGGSPAKLKIEASIPIFTGESSGLCGTGNAKWEGSYVLTAPGSLFVVKDGTMLTSPTGSEATSVFKASNENGHVVFVSVVSNIGCSLSFEGTPETPTTGKPAAIPLANVSILGCTGGSHVTVPTPGRLEIEWTNGYNGTVFWTGGTVEWTGGQNLCNYVTQRTEIGTITGGSPATIHLSGRLPVESAGALCLNRSDPTLVEGDLVVTAPSSVFVDPTS